jgi:hypothetical protein
MSVECLAEGNSYLVFYEAPHSRSLWSGSTAQKMSSIILVQASVPCSLCWKWHSWLHHNGLSFNTSSILEIIQSFIQRLFSFHLYPGDSLSSSKFQISFWLEQYIIQLKYIRSYCNIPNFAIILRWAWVLGGYCGKRKEEIHGQSVQNILQLRVGALLWVNLLNTMYFTVSPWACNSWQIGARIW